MDREGFCYRFYGGNKPSFDDWDHEFDLGCIVMLVIWVIDECLLVSVLYLLFLDQEQEK